MVKLEKENLDWPYDIQLSEECPRKEEYRKIMSAAPHSQLLKRINMLQPHEVSKSNPLRSGICRFELYSTAIPCCVCGSHWEHADIHIDGEILKDVLPERWQL